jgi:uncharacterized protein YciI
MKQVFAVVRARGAAWQWQKRLEEQVQWEEHRVFMTAMEDEGFVVLGGPLEDTGEALLIFRADSAEEIAGRLEADPWTPLDLLRTARVTRWQVRIGKLP